MENANARPAGLEPGAVLIGTVALEPNRWGLRSPDRAPELRTADWLEAAERAGFDGIELWENHATRAGDEEVERLVASPLPIAVFSTYASFDVDDDTERNAVAEWVGRLACPAVKFNVGNDAGSADAYAERLARFAGKLPSGTRLVCECHAGTIAEDPTVALRILAAVAAADRLQALVHLGDDAAVIDAAFAALGDRIRHVHVNFLRQGAPPLAEIEDDLRARVGRLAANGFAGSYTVEFVNGVGTERDAPPSLVDAAVRDLATLRSVLPRAG